MKQRSLYTVRDIVEYLERRALQNGFEEDRVTVSLKNWPALKGMVQQSRHQRKYNHRYEFHKLTQMKQKRKK